MTSRTHTIAVLVRRRSVDHLTAPGVYIVLSLSFVIGYLLDTSFVRAVDAAGFDPAGDPVYAITAQMLTSVFGTSFVNSLFSEGPQLFFLYRRCRTAV